MILSSKLIEDAVSVFCRLPGIGKKTALRMVLHLLKEDKEQVFFFSETIAKMRDEITFCISCNNISDGQFCSICIDPHRQKDVVCIVENIRDVISIESTRQYNGVYHVLGNLLSPLDGIGPEQLMLSGLINKVKSGEVTELIMALNPTIEGDTTVYYINKQLKEFNIKMTSIARGVSFGGELEFTDELTLGRAITKRLPMENYINVT